MGRVALLVVAVAGLGCEDLLRAGERDASADDASSAADAGPLGAACRVEAETGAELCAATSLCPSVTVNPETLPGCGFRMRAGAVDLVCACGAALCPVGAFGSCDEAARLLAAQTQQGVCVQVAEGRCSETTGASGPARNPACDPQCMRDCGGGEACAAVCNCS